MPGRVNVVITAAPGIGAGIELIKTAAVAADNHKLANQAGSRVILIVNNRQAAATVEVTIKKVAQTVHADDIVAVVPAATVYVFGPLPEALYTQPAGDDVGYVQVDLDVDTTVDLYAISF